ncbi:MAG: hypothetical protein QM611_01945 [Microbacterium sp.]|uniref:hypothetical protein n=1 Tax=Microbacterium sp. TaxID=51671 RepID=UPI0039E34737
MRTTLDLDPAVLSAARAKASAEGMSLGKAVSELALAGIRRPRSDRPSPSGFPVLAGVVGHPVTDELVAARFAELESWSTCSATETGLLRLLMTEQVVGRKVTGSEALAHVDAMRQAPGWGFLPDTVSLAAPHIDTRVLMGRRQATFDAALVPDDQRWVSVWSG